MRRSTSLLLIPLVAFVLAACGDDDSTNNGPGDMGGTMGGTMGGGTMGSTMGGGTMGDAGDHQGASPVAEGARRIEVTAANLEFDPNEITVTAGEDVAIVLTSHDLLHDFTVDELDAHVAADTGDTVDGGLRADEPGRYTFYCSVPGHREAGMEGTLIVEAP